MKRNVLLLTLALCSGSFIHAQSVTTKTGLRLYEHHSPMIAGGQGASGVQSAYDFVNHTYYNSYDSATFDAYTNGEEANIDMAEHNGPYGNQGPFGFTSGVSSIWNGDIQGNGTTKWMKAPQGFNYATIADVSDIATAYNASMATTAIAEVEENAIYLGKIRNTDLYVAMRAFNIKNKGGGNNDVYFDFEYKFGTLVPAGISDVDNNSILSISPNPATNNIKLENKSRQPLTAKLISMNGQTIQSISLSASEVKSMDVNSISSGLYFIVCTSQDGHSYTQKLVKQ